jgi:YfiH family protein
MQFPNLSQYPELIHGIFTRRGGCSQKPFESLNVGFGLGDEDEHVHRNRELLARVLANGRLVLVHQVHGDHVVTVDADRHVQGRSGKNPDTRWHTPTGDALMTGTPGQLLTIQVADCQAVLVYDPVQRVVANVHAGWRGTIRNVVGATIERMQAAYGCAPGDLVAGIGPSLGPCCAEFVNFRQEIPPQFWHHKTDGNHFNFWDITREQLGQAGVAPGNVWISEICTRCNPKIFYSYRGEKVTGRFAAVIGLRPKAQKATGP